MGLRWGSNGQAHICVGRKKESNCTGCEVRNEKEWLRLCGDGEAERAGRMGGEWGCREGRRHEAKNLRSPWDVFAIRRK